MINLEKKTMLSLIPFYVKVSDKKNFHQSFNFLFVHTYLSKDNSMMVNEKKR